MGHMWVRCLNDLKGGLMMEFLIRLVASMFLRYVPNPGCYPPNCWLLSSHAARDSPLEAGDKWASLAASHIAVEARCSYTVYPFPLWEKLQAKRALLGWAVLPCRRDDVGRVKLFLLPSPMCLDSNIFAPVVCWNFPTRLLGFHITNKLAGFNNFVKF